MPEVLMNLDGQADYAPKIEIRDLSPCDNNILNSELTPLQKFYTGQSIFVTGGTGFIGKLLIEKLLRTCPNLAFIYLLVRPKKGKDVHQRTEELFDDSLFDRLKKAHPKFRHQIVSISGDCSLPNLGLSPTEQALVVREVSIVFHVAATVRFNEKLKSAVAINVKGIKDVLALCKKMPKLKSCIHVSTAFANCVYNTIEEKFYDVSIDPDKLVSLIESIDEKLVDDISNSLLGRWPNTYTFTKAVAEIVVRKEGVDIPVGIFRPAIVISTYQEPITGWIDNIYGAPGVAASASTGLLRSLHCDGSMNANLVPGDMTVNALIASAWDVANIKQNNKNSNEIPIYNYVSKDNTIRWDEKKDLMEKYLCEIPPSQAIWYKSFRYTKNRLVHLFYIYFLHLLPALLIDTVIFCVGKKPRMLKLYQKIHKLIDALSYFLTNEWTFTNDRIHSLIDKLDRKDRLLFNLDMRDVVWDTYFQSYMKGIRLYILKDPIDTLPQSRIRWQRLYWLHQVVKVVLGYGLLRLCWFALNALISMLL